jgi:hypothetical protein
MGQGYNEYQSPGGMGREDLDGKPNPNKLMAEIY